MTPDLVLGIVREAVMVILIMVAPLLGTGLLVGLTVSVFQATTQIQEPTLAFVPKIVAVLGALLLFGGWILRVIIQFTQKLWENGLTVL